MVGPTSNECVQHLVRSKDTGMVAEKLLDLDEVFKEAVRAHEVHD